MRKKHVKDTKANGYWDRWFRALCNGKGRFKHSDRKIGGKLFKKKQHKKIEKQEIGGIYENEVD